MKKLIVGLGLLWYAGGSAFAQSPDTLRFVHYNLLFYGDASCGSLTNKNARLKTIFNALRPDVLTVNEMTPNSGDINSLRTNA